MTKRGILLICVTLVFSSAALAGTITFDPFPGIPPGVMVQYFDGGLTGPLATLPTPNTVALIESISAIPGGGSALETYFFPVGPYGVLFTFSTPVTSFGLVGNDFGGDPILDNEIVHLTMFDSAGLFLYSATSSVPYGVPNLNSISVSGPAATYVAFTWTNDLGYYAIDNVSYSGVPEPTSILLLCTGLGAVGLAACRRKKA